MEKKEMLPKIKGLQFNHVLVTADYKGKDSGILLSDGSKKERVAKDIQTVIAVGPHVVGIKAGDKIISDNRKLSAKNALIITVAYNKLTGEVIHDDNIKDIKEEDCDFAFLLTDREILFAID